LTDYIIIFVHGHKITMLTFYMDYLIFGSTFLSIDHTELDLERRGTESTDFCYMYPILSLR